MKLRVFLAVVGTAAVAFTLGAQGRNEAKVEKSPHAAALGVVFKTQQARIREVDGEDWWHDLKERAWVVKRPFSPGVVNSTHWFNVSYRIDGKEAASWCVDTAKGTAEPTDAKVK